MKNICSETEKALLNRIAQQLILHSSYLENVGLCNGKMGIVLFFAHYFRYTQNSLYDEFASELLGEIYEDITNKLPVDFENGLCGIGWGIEYLLQEGFMPGDSNEILKELDQRVMQHDLRRITDLSFETGLVGISCYIHSRLSSSQRQETALPFDEIYFEDWRGAMSKHSIEIPQDVFALLFRSLPQMDDEKKWLLGIDNGYAGVGLSILLK